MLEFYLRTRVALRELARHENGATLAEYALLLAFIALVCVLAITALGGSLRDIYQDFAGAFGGLGG
jgi:pilus assembly protein Flp/PilA